MKAILLNTVCFSNAPLVVASEIKPYLEAYIFAKAPRDAYLNFGDYGYFVKVDATGHDYADYVVLCNSFDLKVAPEERFDELFRTYQRAVIDYRGFNKCFSPASQAVLKDLLKLLDELHGATLDAHVVDTHFCDAVAGEAVTLMRESLHQGLTDATLTEEELRHAAHHSYKMTKHAALRRLAATFR